MFDVAEEAHKEMLLSGFKKPIHSKPTDLGLWNYTSRVASLIRFINVQ
jgi:hypothetical protein